MAYLTEKSTVPALERQLITIEFAPKLDPSETEYSYSQPLFVFGEQVIPRSHLGSDNAPSTICAMELVEFKTPSGRLFNQPYWRYLLNDGQQKLWLNESALVRYSSTCSQCPHFNDFDDDLGRGWCNLFAVAARQHHLRTNDCDLHQNSDPLDAPHSRFAIESIVKVIDPVEHHSEWATFTVIARRHNTQLHRSTEAYLSEPDWFYQLAALPYKETVEPLWVAENDICAFNESHLISTKDIF